jgi:DNA-directed RNA polymerase subunit RPC12/RpoP
VGEKMIQYEEEEIHLCVNCDAEFLVSRIDADGEDIKFCPYCGYELNSDDAFDDEDDDYS